MSKVSKLINCLTEDEDKRQDLWVHYLSGNSISSFKFESLISTIDQDVQAKLLSIEQEKFSNKFNALMQHFSPFEQSIVCLLALGLTVSQISEYKDISEIRIKQIISVIRQNNCWEKLYGVKEKING